MVHTAATTTTHRAQDKPPLRTPRVTQIYTVGNIHCPRAKDKTYLRTRRAGDAGGPHVDRVPHRRQRPSPTQPPPTYLHIHANPYCAERRLGVGSRGRTRGAPSKIETPLIPHCPLHSQPTQTHTLRTQQAGIHAHCPEPRTKPTLRTRRTGDAGGPHVDRAPHRQQRLSPTQLPSTYLHIHESSYRAERRLDVGSRGRTRGAPSKLAPSLILHDPLHLQPTLHEKARVRASSLPG